MLTMSLAAANPFASDSFLQPPALYPPPYTQQPSSAPVSSSHSRRSMGVDPLAETPLSPIDALALLEDLLLAGGGDGSALYDSAHGGGGGFGGAAGGASYEGGAAGGRPAATSIEGPGDVEQQWSEVGIVLDISNPFYTGGAAGAGAGAGGSSNGGAGRNSSISISGGSGDGTAGAGAAAADSAEDAMTWPVATATVIQSFWPTSDTELPLEEGTSDNLSRIHFDDSSMTHDVNTTPTPRIHFGFFC